MKLRVKREMNKQSIDIVSLLIIVGKTRPDYQTMVKSRSNCFTISGCCVITGTGSNMVRHFGHYEMLCNRFMEAAILNNWNNYSQNAHFPLLIDSSTDLNDRYSNLFLNAYIYHHAHTENLK